MLIRGNAYFAKSTDVAKFALGVPPGTPGFPDNRGPTPQPVGAWGWLRLLYKIAREWRKERKHKRKARR